MARNCNLPRQPRNNQQQNSNNNRFNQPNYSRSLQRPNSSNTYPHHTVNNLETIEPNEAYVGQTPYPRVSFNIPSPTPPKYNIMRDLNNHHANITFGQLMNIPEMDTQLRTFLNQKDHQVNAAEIPNVKAAARIYVSVKNRSEEHTSELQSQSNLVCRLLLEKK